MCVKHIWKYDLYSDNMRCCLSFFKMKISFSDLKIEWLGKYLIQKEENRDVCMSYSIDTHH